MIPKVIAVCSSKKKGTNKIPIDSGFLQIGIGLIGDAHADGPPQREISLLATESIKKMNVNGYVFKPGDFAENITTRGIKLTSVPIGTQLKVGEDVILEVTQIGKKCHTDCAIFKEVGKCIMPREGVFAKVIHSGSVKAGDTIEVLS
ncbi:MAG: MOSC domain-containing protein [Chloroflexi bacterium]|nr:MOSC domain-containing protein [Chloroflexota bacterium]